MQKIVVVAQSANRVIGANNDLVWNLPADLKHYHQLIAGSWVIMGRRTFESEYGVLPVQKTIVVTRQLDYSTNESATKVVQSLTEGIQWAASQGQEKLFILGGGQIYKQAMPLADTIIATEVHGTFEGDTFFPHIPLSQWEVIGQQTYLADAENSHTFDIVFYKKRTT